MPIYRYLLYVCEPKWGNALNALPGVEASGYISSIYNSSYSRKSCVIVFCIAFTVATYKAYTVGRVNDFLRGHFCSCVRLMHSLPTCVSCVCVYAVSAHYCICKNIIKIAATTNSVTCAVRDVAQ